MVGRTHLLMRLVALLAAASLGAIACGGSGGGDEEGADAGGVGGNPAAIQDEGQPPPAPAGTLRLTSRFYPLSLDPQRDTNYKGVWFTPMYDSLTVQDAAGDLQPWLATSWERPDPLTWRFELRTDVTFHDGSAFDASVVKKNFDRTKADKASPHAGVFNPMKEVVVIDTDTVEVRFTTPSPTFPLSLSNNPGMMVSGKAIDSGADLTRSPAGSGGWILDPSQSLPQQSETYNRNPSYWKPDVVHVEKIIVVHINDNTARHNALMSDQVDVVDDAQGGRREDMEAKGFRTITFPVTFDSVHVFDRGGHLQPELADPRVREAITWLIDREGYLEVVHNGHGSAAAGPSQGIGSCLVISGRLAQDRVVAAPVQLHHDPPVPAPPPTRAVSTNRRYRCFGARLLAPLQPAAQPAVAAVGQHRQRRVQVHVQPHLARQAVQVEEVHRLPSPSSTRLRPA